MLKDTSDRTAFKVFEPGGTARCPASASPTTCCCCPIPAASGNCPGRRPAAGCARSPGSRTAGRCRWTRGACCRTRWRGSTPPATRCAAASRSSSTSTASPTRRRNSIPSWRPGPGLPPAVQLVHPGYNLLAEGWYDQAEEPLRIVQNTAQALGLPLASLEIELGPSQVEAVFDVSDALTAADNMVLFRNGVRQSLRRAGYHATFMCRPPFPNIMSSGWHLHQSLVDKATGRTCSCASSRPKAARRPMRRTRCRRWASSTWPGCWPMRAAWRCSARRRSTASAASGRTHWRRKPCCGGVTTAAPCCA
jgi:glutamine synthetase